MISRAIVSLMCAAGVLSCPANGANPNPNPEWDSQWPTLESPFLTDHVQLTSQTTFLKAGENYFSPDGRFLIFQAIPLPEDGHEAEAHYSMFVGALKRDDAGNIIGLGQANRVSEPGSANTCGWFHPTEPMKILFGTTTVPPAGEDVAGFQRKTSKYSWQFPVEMDIVSGTLSMTYVLSTEAEARAKKLAEEDTSKTPDISISDIVSVPALTESAPLWERLGYDAEGSWSPDGRYILYTRLEPGDNNGDIWIYDLTDGSHLPLVVAEGYDGGPFFSPDGKSICYRSDRRGDNLLQIYVSYLKFDESGKVIGVDEELQLTDNDYVNWAPFFTPDGKYLFYASSKLGHGNYEVYAIDASGNDEPEDTPQLRITHARGFDGLPAFSPDGQWMIWTAQRGAQREGEDRPSSQVWGAKIDLEAVDRAYQSLRDEMNGQGEDAGFAPGS